MRIFNFIIFFIYIQLIGFSQSSKQNLTLDSIFSAKDILPILIGIDSSFRHNIVLDSVTLWDSAYQNIYGAKKSNSYYKYDVDSNGKTDIVVQITDSFTHYSDIVVLLDSGTGRFSLKYITSMAYNQYFKINVVKLREREKFLFLSCSIRGISLRVI